MAVAGTTIERKAIVSRTKLRPEHEHEHDREPGVHDVVVVDVLRRGPADERLGAGALERGRDDIGPKIAHGRHRGRGDGVAGDGEGEDDQRAVGAGLRPRRPEDLAPAEPVFQSRDALLHVGGGGVALDDDPHGIDRLPGELLVQEQEALLRLEAVGERADPGRAALQREHGDHRARRSATAATRLTTGRRMTARTMRPQKRLSVPAVVLPK